MGWLLIYRSLDKGYLVYLFSVAYLQHAGTGCIWHNKNADSAFQRSQGQTWTISQTPAVWVLFIFEVKGESSPPNHNAPPKIPLDLVVV